MNNRLYSILVVEDHTIYREAIVEILIKTNLTNEVDEAENGKIALAKIESKQYDIVFLDIEMPELNGIETTRIIKEKYQDIKIIILTSHQYNSKVIELIEMGISAYLLKNTDKQELINAIEKVIDGDLYLSKDVYDVYAKHLIYNTSKSENDYHLTEREIEIIKLLCQQLTANEIAEKLFISEQTVKNHRYRIMKKLDTNSVIGIVVFAIRNQIFTI
jgi:two-component system, NarL family, response regulator DegU